MKTFGRLLAALAVVIAANIIFWPPNTVAIDHSEKPEGRKSQRNYFEKALAQARPEVVLMGNSMLTEGVDPRLFMKYTRKRTLMFSRGGSASAWWYLGLKNIIAESPAKPELLVIFFRDDFLTRPGFRVTDSYKLAINDLANENEPLLDRLAYLNGMDYPSYVLNKYSPLYQQREGIRKDIKTFIKQSSAKLFQVNDVSKVDSALQHVFDRKNMDQTLMTARQAAAESTEAGKADFYNNLNKSFLPHIIEEAKDNNIKLAFVRVKRRRDIKPDAEPEYVKNYIANLKDFLEAQSIEMIDFTDNPQLKLNHYADGDHLDRKTGRPLFTKMVAEKLIPIILENGI